MITIKQQQYAEAYCKHLANDGWSRVAHHGEVQAIYQQGYLPDHNINWKGYQWTRQKAYRRSHEDLGKAVNPQVMH